MTFSQREKASVGEQISGCHIDITRKGQYEGIWGVSIS
jgi:hypothetical protein